MRPTADYWIKKLQLSSHVEGGAFREVYRSPITAPASTLPAIFNGERSFCTAIYFLLQQGQYSAFHKISSDEIWHFYFGDALIVYEIDKEGFLTIHHLGKDPGKGQSFQCVVQAGNWFAATVAPGGEYTLTGCTVSPGFDFADFILADKEELSAKYPQHENLIRSLTK